MLFLFITVKFISKKQYGLVFTIVCRAEVIVLFCSASSIPLVALYRMSFPLSPSPYFLSVSCVCPCPCVCVCVPAHRRQVEELTDSDERWWNAVERKKEIRDKIETALVAMVVSSSRLPWSVHFSCLSWKLKSQFMCHFFHYKNLFHSAYPLLLSQWSDMNCNCYLTELWKACA